MSSGLDLSNPHDLKLYLSTRSIDIPTDDLTRDLKKLVRWALKRDRYDLVEAAGQALKAGIPVAWMNAGIGMRKCATFVLYDYPNPEGALDYFPALFDWAAAAGREAMAQSMGALV